MRRTVSFVWLHMRPERTRTHTFYTRGIVIRTLITQCSCECGCRANLDLLSSACCLPLLAVPERRCNPMCKRSCSRSAPAVRQLRRAVPQPADPPDKLHVPLLRPRPNAGVALVPPVRTTANGALIMYVGCELEL
jgi:hypothetical protein